MNALFLLIYNSLPTLLAMIGGIIAIMKGIRGIHISLNSRLSELLAATKELAHREGLAEGRASEKQQQQQQQQH